jgi:hypothetical protein
LLRNLLDRQWRQLEEPEDRCIAAISLLLTSRAMLAVSVSCADLSQFDSHASVPLDPDDLGSLGKPDRLAAFRPGVQVRVPAPSFAVGADSGHDEVHDIGLRPRPASHGLPPPMARRIASSAIRVAEHGCCVSAALHPAQISLPGKG